MPTKWVMWRSRCTQRGSIPLRCKNPERLQLIMRISCMANGTAITSVVHLMSGAPGGGLWRRASFNGCAERVLLGRCLPSSLERDAREGESPVRLDTYPIYSSFDESSSLGMLL